jgi:hypothetical protein
MMGSEVRGVSICLTTFETCAPRLRTLNEIASPIVPKGTIPSAGADCLMAVFISSSCDDRNRLGVWVRRLLAAKAKVGVIYPHAMQDRCELAYDRDARVAPFRDVWQTSCPCSRG